MTRVGKLLIYRFTRDLDRCLRSCSDARVNPCVEARVDEDIRWVVEDLTFNTVVVGRVAPVGTSIWGLNG